MNDDACSLPSCYTCNRVDQAELNETTTTLVTYVGEYAVMTLSAPELDCQPAALAITLGFCELENAYITMVVYLGDENASIRQSDALVDDDDFYRWWTRHNSLDNLKNAHAMVVEGLKSDQLDVSVGKGVLFFEERDANLRKMKDEVARSTYVLPDDEL